MKTGISILFFFILVSGRSQDVFKALGPEKSVVAGESFQIQYVIESDKEVENFAPPSFKGFIITNGPEVYSEMITGLVNAQHKRNFVYTLKPVEPGRYLLQGAIIKINGKKLHSNPLLINVISKEENYRNEKLSQPVNDALFLRPGEDPDEKIRKNLFVRVYLDKKTCFTGEPVVATFKLYSRLQSRSDIVKNPGFYGFTVQDIINLDDAVVSIERIDGKEFDVHTIRKVQLYPLQSGEYWVDAMEIRNRVEFFRSLVTRKAEQEIVEGIFPDKSEALPGGTEVFESNISTPALKIKVKPTPEQNKPGEYNGATGNFSIEAMVEQDKIYSNKQAFLRLIIRGNGNFTQLVAPEIKWPEAVEGFEPIIIDQLDKAFTPLRGSRIFRFPFVVKKPGNYQFPSFEFTYFNPDSNKYKKSSTLPFAINVLADQPHINPVGTSPVSLKELNKKASRIAGIIVISLVLIVLLYWILKPKPIEKKQPISIIKERNSDDAMKPVYMLLPAADRDFYELLYGQSWDWLKAKFQLTGSGLNKRTLRSRLQEAGLSEEITEELLFLLSKCEEGMYTEAVIDYDKEKLLKRIHFLFKEIDEQV